MVDRPSRIGSPEPTEGSECERLRLRDRRRRIGGVRARQPAQRLRRGGAADRGRAPRPLAEDQDPRRLRPAVPDEARLGLCLRARARLRGAVALRSPRQGARRLQLDERDALRPRPPRRLRRLAGRRRMHRLGLERRAALLQALRAPRGRRESVARGRRPAQRRAAPQPPSAHRPDRQGRARGRLRARPRPQRRRPGRDLHRRDHDQARSPLERRRRVPPSRRRPAEPHGPDRGDGARPRDPGRPRARGPARRQDPDGGRQGPA